MLLQTLLFLILSLNTVYSIECPEGSLEIETKNGMKCYLFGNCKKRFISADYYCKYLNGNLVSIHNEFDNDLITKKAESLAFREFWIGVHNTTGKGLVYTENGQKVDYSNLKSTNDSGNGCVAMDKSGNWLNDRCCSRKFFICELPPVDGGSASDSNNGPTVKQTNPTTTTTVTTTTAAPTTTARPLICPNATLVKILRSYHHTAFDHLYTHYIQNQQNAAKNGWRVETPMGFIARKNYEKCPDLVPLYRLWNVGIADHFYTTSVAERNRAKSALGYREEDHLGHCSKKPGPCLVPFHRFYSAGLRDHFYTISANEKNVVQSQGRYAYEGIQCYVWVKNATC